MYGRVLTVEGEAVRWEDIYHNDDGSERIGPPWLMSPRDFTEHIFGGC